MGRTSILRRVVRTTGQGAIAPVPAPSGMSGGTLPASGFPASSAPPVPAGAQGLTDAIINPGGSPYGSAAFGPFPVYGGGYGGGWWNPWWSAGWGWPYDLQWWSSPTPPAPPPEPWEIYTLPLRRAERLLYCRRLYRHYCARWPASRYCLRWAWMCA